MPIKSLLFPTRNLCYLCKDKATHIEAFTCLECYEKLDFIYKEVQFNSIYIDSMYYALSYNRYLRELIHDFKFNGKSYLYKPLAEFIINMIKEKKIYDIDLIMYIPIHRRKEAIRGYNQSRLLAEYISNTLEIPISNGNLIKKKWTKEQNTLDRIQRFVNIKDSFYLKNSKEVYGKRIIIIDDLVTTGATFNECSKLLKTNEAKEIIALALTSSKTI